MKKIIASLMAASLISFAAFAATSEIPRNHAQAGDHVRIAHVDLKPSTFTAGALGRATFVAVGESSEVVFFIAHINSYIGRPVHIYSYIYRGSCENLDEMPSYEMNNTTIMDKAGHNAWRVIKGLPVALSSLLAGGYAVVVRSSPADGNYDLFCGEIQ